MTARADDINGWMEVKKNPLSKAGVYPYTGGSIDPSGKMGLDPNKIYQVYRPAEELSSNECVDSFKLLPWINDHVMLGDELTPAEEKGIEGVIGEEVFFDDSDKTLKGNIKVFSKDLKNLIENGKDELSCGYRCDYEIKKGVFDGKQYDIVQRTIRGNHLALVDEGRMGPEVSVLDCANKMSFVVDSGEFLMSDEEKVEDAKMEDSEKSYDSPIEEKLVELAATVSALVEKVESLSGSSEAAEDECAEDAGGNGPKKSDSDSEENDELKNENDRLKNMVEDMKTSMDSFQRDGIKKMLAEVKRKNELADKISLFTGAFDHSEMSELDVAAYGVEKLSIPCGGDKIAAITGFLHSRNPERRAFALDSSTGSDKISAYLNGER